MRYLATLLACLSMFICGCDKKSAEYRKAYAQGVIEAEAEISANSPAIYASGTHAVPVPEDLKDDETGLPVKYIAGCILTDSEMGRQDGHNKTVLGHIKKENP